MTPPAAGRGLAALLATQLLLASAAAAQPPGDQRSLRAGRLAVGGGLLWQGPYDIGAADAVLRGNAPGASPPPFVLFRAESRVLAATAAEARVTWTWPGGVALEAGVGYGRPAVSTRVGGDREQPAGASVDDTRLVRYTFEGGATWQLPLSLAGGHLRPFLAAGAGHIRELDDERTLVETGRLLHAGGGVRYFLRGGDGRRRAFGVRGDVRLAWRRGGIDFHGRTRRAPVIGLQVFAEL